MDRLRSPGGCPWDLEQTSNSLKPYLLEEAHEVAEAIERGDPSHLREELGDLLLNIFLQARIGEEESQFTLAEVADGISDKLIRRHPHVFGNDAAADSSAVRKRWEEIKREEKGDQGSPDPISVLRPLPPSLPALSQGQRLGTMAAEVGFDWPDADGPLRKLEEELGEIQEAHEAGDPTRVEAEVGDLLFAITSYCRHQRIDGEKALRGALRRFRDRFRHVEASLQGPGKHSLDELEALWRRAKELSGDLGSNPEA